MPTTTDLVTILVLQMIVFVVEAVDEGISGGEKLKGLQQGGANQSEGLVCFLKYNKRRTPQTTTHVQSAQQLLSVVVFRVGDAWLVGVGKCAPHGFRCPCLVSPHGSLDRLKSLYIIPSILNSKWTFSCAQIDLRKARERELATLLLDEK